MSIAETHSGKRIERIRTDNGGEFIDEKLKRFHGTVPRGIPGPKGVAERMNRTLVEKVRAFLSGAQLGLVLWTETVDVVTYARDR